MLFIYCCEILGAKTTARSGLLVWVVDKASKVAVFVLAVFSGFGVFAIFNW